MCITRRELNIGFFYTSLLFGASPQTLVTLAIEVVVLENFLHLDVKVTLNTVFRKVA